MTELRKEVFISMKKDLLKTLKSEKTNELQFEVENQQVTISYDEGKDDLIVEVKKND